MAFELKRWHILLVFSFVLSLGMFFRHSWLGFDSHASWACVVNGWCDTLGVQFLFVRFLEFMPAIPVLFKLLMIVSLFFSVYAWFLLIKHVFDERLAWYSIFLGIPLLPVIFFEFAKLENELIGMPLVFWGLFCFVCCRSWKKLLGLVFWGASLLFWVWPYYFIFDINEHILELQLFSGFLSLFFGIFFLMLVFLVKNNWVRLFFVFFLFGGFMSGKLIVLLVPFCLLGIAQGIRMLRNNNYDIKFLIPIAFIMLIGLNYSVFISQPTSSELDLIESTIELSIDTNYPIKNDWSYGYWFWTKGFKTKFNGATGTSSDYNIHKKPFVAFTNKNLGNLSCEYHDGFVSLAREVYIWKCD